jgi:hypothetical protein
MSNELTVAAAAKASGYTRQRLYQLIDAGRIAVRRQKVTRYELRIPRSVVEELAVKRAA